MLHHILSGALSTSQPFRVFLAYTLSVHLISVFSKIQGCERVSFFCCVPLDSNCAAIPNNCNKSVTVSLEQVFCPKSATHLPHLKSLHVSQQYPGCTDRILSQGTHSLSALSHITSHKFRYQLSKKKQHSI